jgi:ribose 5-phosphate isomerase B
MKIAIAADHRGKEVQTHLNTWLSQEGFDVVEFSTCDCKAGDYPDYAYPVATAVADGDIDMGVLICGTGIGMCIAANKVKGIRAALVHDEIGADLSRRHNDANILCLSADMLGQRIINRIVKTWLTTEFDGGRHARRNSKINAIEQGLNPIDCADTQAVTE